MQIDKAFLERELANAHKALRAAEDQLNFCKGAVSMLEQLVKVVQEPVIEPVEQ